MTCRYHLDACDCPPPRARRPRMSARVRATVALYDRLIVALDRRYPAGRADVLTRRIRSRLESFTVGECDAYYNAVMARRQARG